MSNWRRVSTAASTAAAIAVIAGALGCKQSEPPAPPATSADRPASAVAVNPVPADAPKSSMTTGANEAGSAIGATAGGNTTDSGENFPRPKPGATPETPQHTGGDGSPGNMPSQAPQPQPTTPPSKDGK